MKKRICSQCKAGDIEISSEAEYFVKGKIVNERFTGPEFIPYQAYLCEDHLVMLRDDGAKLKATKV